MSGIGSKLVATMLAAVISASHLCACLAMAKSAPVPVTKNDPHACCKEAPAEQQPAQQGSEPCEHCTLLKQLDRTPPQRSHGDLTAHLSLELLPASVQLDAAPLAVVVVGNSAEDVPIRPVLNDLFHTCVLLTV